MKNATETKYTRMMWVPQRSQILIFSQFCRHPNFSTKMPGMPGRFRVKFGCRQNWLKIEIWDPRATCSKALHSVSVANSIPPPSSFVRLRGIAADKNRSEACTNFTEEVEEWRRHIILPSLSPLEVHARNIPPLQQ